MLKKIRLSNEKRDFLKSLRSTDDCNLKIKYMLDFFALTTWEIVSSKRVFRKFSKRYALSPVKLKKDLLNILIFNVSLMLKDKMVSENKRIWLVRALLFEYNSTLDIEKSCAEIEKYDLLTVQKDTKGLMKLMVYNVAGSLIDIAAEEDLSFMGKIIAAWFVEVRKVISVMLPLIEDKISTEYSELEDETRNTQY